MNTIPLDMLEWAAEETAKPANMAAYTVSESSCLYLQPLECAFEEPRLRKGDIVSLIRDLGTPNVIEGRVMREDTRTCPALIKDHEFGLVLVRRGEITDLTIIESAGS